MNYNLLKDSIDLLEQFEADALKSQYPGNIKGFTEWIAVNTAGTPIAEPEWQGKDQGRSPESVISTMLVHLNRYAKMYSKLAISNSGFSTQEDFIYLINLKAFGAMTKTELIRRNIQDKPTGMLIISRLIKQGWVQQSGSDADRRSKVICITAAGLEALEAQMDKIRQATKIVTGNLTHTEKMELIRLLQKLDNFHSPIFNSGISGDGALETISRNYLTTNNR